MTRLCNKRFSKATAITAAFRSTSIASINTPKAHNPRHQAQFLAVSMSGPCQPALAGAAVVVPQVLALAG